MYFLLIYLFIDIDIDIDYNKYILFHLHNLQFCSSWPNKAPLVSKNQEGASRLEGFGFEGFWPLFTTKTMWFFPQTAGDSTTSPMSQIWEPPN